MRYRRFAQRRESNLFNALTKAGIEAANFHSAPLSRTQRRTNA